MMGLTKGTRLTSPRTFVTQRFGAEEWEALVEPLCASDRVVLAQAVPAGWYDHAIRARLVRRLSIRVGGAMARELGRYEAECDLMTVLRWFLRLVKPSFAVRNMNLYWCRSESGGRWTSEVSDKVIVARLHGWDPVEPALCHTLLGYLARTLEFLGSGEVAIDHTHCRAGGDPFCEFRTESFRAEGLARWSDTALTPSDVTGITLELAQLTDLEALAEAVVDVLIRRLSFSYVALYVRTVPRSEPRLLRARGAEGGGVFERLLLHTCGGTLGWLHIEARADRCHPEMLDLLLPCFAVALRGAGACLESLPEVSHSSPDHLKCRVDIAAHRWGATPRQQGVLELVVQGLTNKEIASQLGCQEGTVEVHVSQLLKKSGAGNRAGLVAKVWSEP
jgi:DNA-binding CsgD family transcriptional regulator/predicted hydrocarbon binding protein